MDISHSVSQKNYIPSLDGWRAIAILGVIFAHFGRWIFNQEGLLPNDAMLRISNGGGYGVDLFFAISGFLICSRMLQGIEKRGSLNLKSFYIRRVFRIIPPAAFFLLCLFLLRILGWIEVTNYELVSSLTFWRNYLFVEHAASEVNFTGHFWSLSVEEHFYIFFPFMLYFLGRNKALIGSFILILWVIVWRAIDSRYQLFTHIHPSFSFNVQHTFCRLDGLLWGVVFAILVEKHSFRHWLKRFYRPWVFSLFMAATLGLIYFRFPAQRVWLAFLFAALVLYTTQQFDRSYFAKLLEIMPLRFIGRISYSLYIWQELFAHTQKNSPSTLHLLQSFPMQVLMTFGIATLSFVYLEKPFINLGRRLAKKFE